MKLHQPPPSTPIHDYSNAIQSAVSWLGSRYLLAAPINSRPHRRPPALWSLSSDRWLAPNRERAG